MTEALFQYRVDVTYNEKGCSYAQYQSSWRFRRKIIGVPNLLKNSIQPNFYNQINQVYIKKHIFWFKLLDFET